MCFLILWFICLSSFIFKNDPEYLPRGTTQAFNPLIRFLLYSLVSSSFLVLLRYSFLIFSFISTSLIVSASSCYKYWLVSTVVLLFYSITDVIEYRAIYRYFSIKVLADLNLVADKVSHFSIKLKDKMIIILLIK